MLRCELRRIMKKREQKKELQKLNKEELLQKVEGLRRDLFNVRLSASTAHVKDSSQFKKLRRSVARGLTYAKQKAQGSSVDIAQVNNK